MSGPADKDDDKDCVALAGEYALGLLVSPETELVEARMISDPDFAALVAEWQEGLLPMLEDTAAVQPPPGLIGRLEKQLFAEQNRPLWQRLNVLQALIGAAAAAAVLYLAVSFDLLTNHDGLPPPDVALNYAATLISEENALLVAATYAPETGELVLRREAGRAAPGRDLELWLVPDDGPAISLGVLGPDLETRITLAEAHRALLPQAALALSDEPLGGSPTGAATGSVIAVAGLSAR